MAQKIFIGSISISVSMMAAARLKRNAYCPSSSRNSSAKSEEFHFLLRWPSELYAPILPRPIVKDDKSRSEGASTQA
jgi:hypothetical protein